MCPPLGLCVPSRGAAAREMRITSGVAAEQAASCNLNWVPFPQVIRRQPQLGMVPLSVYAE